MPEIAASCRVISAVVSAVFLSACVNSQATAPIRLNVRSDPPGAMIYQGSQQIGQAPITINYAQTDLFRSGGCTPIIPIQARWISGATAVGPRELCASNTMLQNFSFFRPAAPGLDLDVQYHLQQQIIEEARRSQAAAQRARDLEVARQLLSPTPNPAQTCQVFGNMVRCF